jgi:hypothetical protein
VRFRAARGSPDRLENERHEAASGRQHLTRKQDTTPAVRRPRNSMHARERVIALQFGDFILELQLSAFHFGQFQLVRGGIHHFLGNFLIERIVTLSERGQMGLT